MRLFHLGRLLVRQLVAGLARETLGEQAAAHADAPMDTPHRQLDATQLERFAPGERVLVDAVGERAVEVEQDGWAVGAVGAVGHGHISGLKLPTGALYSMDASVPSTTIVNKSKTSCLIVRLNGHGCSANQSRYIGAGPKSHATTPNCSP